MSSQLTDAEKRRRKRDLVQWTPHLYCHIPCQKLDLDQEVSEKAEETNSVSRLPSSGAQVSAVSTQFLLVSNTPWRKGTI